MQREIDQRGMYRDRYERVIDVFRNVERFLAQDTGMFPAWVYTLDCKTSKEHKDMYLEYPHDVMPRDPTVDSPIVVQFLQNGFSRILNYHAGHSYGSGWYLACPDDTCGRIKKQNWCDCHPSFDFLYRGKCFPANVFLDRPIVRTIRL